MIDYFWEHFRIAESDRMHNPLSIPRTNRIHFAEFLGAIAQRTPDRLLQGVEVGTHLGEYAEVLCQRIHPLHLTIVDPYALYEGYSDFTTRNADRAFRLAQERLAPYNVTFLREYSVPASASFADASLDFVYIDANHRYEYVLEDIAAWIPKVRAGGVISGHDYFNSAAGNTRVRAAVNTWQQQHPNIQVIAFGDPSTDKDWVGTDGHARTWCWFV